MANIKDGIGDGILRGLKKILFTNSGENEPVPADIPAKPVTASPAEYATNIAIDATAGGVKDMKLRIYQLLESINKPGCDFFEVWNASVEMGGADKTLTKDKLLETGGFYIGSLTKVLDTETLKRQVEKDGLLARKEQEKTSLTTEISGLEKQIAELQTQLAQKKVQSEGINQKYEPQLAAIDTKITNGHQSVNSVINEMQQVVAIIQKEIN